MILTLSHSLYHLYNYMIIFLIQAQSLILKTVLIWTGIIKIIESNASKCILHKIAALVSTPVCRFVDDTFSDLFVEMLTDTCLRLSFIVSCLLISSPNIQ